MDNDDQIRKTEHAIERLLESLERETGTLVGDLVLEQIDLSAVGDQRRHHRMCVRIDLIRISGHDWGEP